MRTALVALVLVGLSSFAPLARAADGDLDPSFGGTGAFTVPFGPVGSGTLVRRPDGKILAAAIDATGLAFARYDSTGTLDPAFGAGGIKTVPAPGTGNLVEVALTSTGDIVVLLSDVLARYDADGDLDGGFGSGGVVALPACGTQLDPWEDLLLLDDGKIAVSVPTASIDDPSCVMRFDATGSPDPAFGVNGVATVSSFLIVSVAAQGDRLLIGGYDAAVPGPGVRRLTTDGALDGAFAAQPPLDGSRVTALDVRPDGTILTADEKGRVARLQSNGKPDGTFGVGGLGAALPPADDSAYSRRTALAVQRDGRILVGVSETDLSTFIPTDYAFLARYDVDGSIDDSFGTNGVLSRGGGRLGGLALQPDGKFLVARVAYPNPIFMVPPTLELSRHIGLTLPCPASAAAGCHAGTTPGASAIRMDDPADPKAKFQWSWKKGAATAVGDFGDPVGGDDYALCFYDESSGSVLTAGAVVPGAGLCRGKPCWKPLGTSGLAYKDSTGTRFGIGAIKLKAGAAGKAQMAIKGRGVSLSVPPLPAAVPLRVQLIAENGQCWESTFSSAGTSRNDGTRYQGKSD